MYLGLEGIVGSGKSLQAKLIYDYLKATNPDREIVLTREPGGSEIATDIRRVAQVNRYAEVMHPITEALLYAASRAQTLRTIIEPVLARGGIVVSDRTVYSSIAFQGGGRGLGIDKVWQINEAALSRLPDKVIFLNVELGVALKRLHDSQGDKFESMGEEFFARCMQTYLYMAKNYKNFIEIDGNGDIKTVQMRILHALFGVI